jgi:hypothetical protein
MPGRLLLVALALAVVVACSDDAETAARSTTSTTTIAPQANSAGGATVGVRPGPHSVLTAVIRLRSDEAVRPAVVARSRGHQVRVPRQPEGTRFAIPLVGLRPETRYRIQVLGSDAVRRASRGLEFTSGALPDTLPSVEVTGDPGRARDGYTLFNVSPGIDDLPLPGQLMAVDDEGYVVWYHQGEQNIADARQLPNGNLIFNYGNVNAREIDVLGNLVREWTTRVRVRSGQTDSTGRETYADGAIELETARLHHEVAFPLPSGNYLSLSLEVRPVPGFPAGRCTDDPRPPGVPQVRGDLVVEFTPEGRIVNQIALLDALDPVRQPGVQCEVKTDQLVAGDTEFYDWSHGNSATLFEDQNVVLVSARSLNSVMALRWQRDEDGPAGEVIWQLGPGQDFRLTSGEWFQRQHAPEVQPDGTILIYDNGSLERPFSRAVIYRLDRSGPPGTWTARQVWEHRVQNDDGTPLYADFLGDADSIGGGNILITHGVVEQDGYNSARLIEVERRTGDIVLDITVPPADTFGWRTYRSEHLDTWYPRDADGLPELADPRLP